MSWMGLSTVLAALAGLLAGAHELRGPGARAGARAGVRAGTSGPDRAGTALLLLVWGGLVPVALYLWSQGLAAPWLFGAETFDGGVVETATGLALLAIVGLALWAAIRTRRRLEAGFWVGGVILAVLVFGEETSWGQHLFHWSSTGVFATANLQGETNLHNFVSPRLYDVAYAVVGWSLIAGAGLLTLRPRRLAPLSRLLPFDRRNPVAIALLVTAGVLLQHELFEEMAEAVTFCVVLYFQWHIVFGDRRPEPSV